VNKVSVSSFPGRANDAGQRQIPGSETVACGKEIAAGKGDWGGRRKEGGEEGTGDLHEKIKVLEGAAQVLQIEKEEGKAREEELGRKIVALEEELASKKGMTKDERHEALIDAGAGGTPTPATDAHKEYLELGQDLSDSHDEQQERTGYVERVGIQISSDTAVDQHGGILFGKDRSLHENPGGNAKSGIFSDERGDREHDDMTDLLLEEGIALEFIDTSEEVMRLNLRGFIHDGVDDILGFIMEEENVGTFRRKTVWEGAGRRVILWQHFVMSKAVECELLKGREKEKAHSLTAHPPLLPALLPPSRSLSDLLDFRVVKSLIFTTITFHSIYEDDQPREISKALVEAKRSGGFSQMARRASLTGASIRITPHEHGEKSCQAYLPCMHCFMCSFSNPSSRHFFLARSTPTANIKRRIHFHLFREY